MAVYPAARRARGDGREFSPFESRGRGECRMPSAPAAPCALGVVNMHTGIHSGGTGKTPGIPHAMVLTAYRTRSPRRRIPLATVAARIGGFICTRLGRVNLRAT